MKTLNYITLPHLGRRNLSRWGYLLGGMMRTLVTVFLVLSINCVGGNCSDSSQYWAKTYGGSWNDSANCIQETAEGGYIIGGQTSSFGAGDVDAWIIKLDGNGNVIWQKTYGGSGYDSILSMGLTADGGYIVAARTGGDPDYAYGWILKLDSNGDVVWQKTYGEGLLDIIYCIQETTDGNYVFAGSTHSFGLGETPNDGGGGAWAMKLDSNGNIIWQKTFGLGGLADKIYSIQETADGSLVFGGKWGVGYPVWDNGLVMKLDSGGNVIWQKSYGGSDRDYIKSVQETADGDYIVTASTFSFSPVDYPAAAWILKLDSNGDVVWQKTYGGGESHIIDSMFLTADGGCIVVARNDLGVEIIKLDGSGNVIWHKIYEGFDLASEILETTDGSYILTGWTTALGAGNFDAFVLKLDSNGDVPYCNISQTNNVTITDTSVIAQVSNIRIRDISDIIYETTVTPADSSAQITSVCCYGSDDFFPQPNGNGIGDACDCEGNFDCDEDCDGTDAVLFKVDFGRSVANNPCTNELHCNGDFDCDNDCDGTDAALFKEDFGRSPFGDPCPTCTQGDWCIY